MKCDDLVGRAGGLITEDWWFKSSSFAMVSMGKTLNCKLLMMRWAAPFAV